MKTAVLGFGRCNPPTIGHVKLFEKIIDVAKSLDAKAYFYLSHSYDGKNSEKPKNPSRNPLSYEDKVRFCQDAAPQGLVINSSNARTPYEALHDLFVQEYENVIFCCGSDRTNEYEMMASYNGKPAPENKVFIFNDITIMSIGRDPDSDDDASKASGSLLRQLAIEGEKEEFIKLSGPKSLAEEMYDTLRKELGI
jgi:hypothetical protein